jgi:hypothetical protein
MKKGRAHGGAKPAGSASIREVVPDLPFFAWHQPILNI